ncbi:hypothetical protein JCGZ_14896 [Jatropha curcas]|uniref:DUF3741 domain-containing protein n=1 Tax=Jatropha curcas TaxID=180498 RepID=A0A067KIW3_JATCU|nr:uncharacterized protein LOC105640024 [Jatropha curcas]KDP31739.1 hypothetical protein JCGZ_14896 [Jatropha curcas]
MNKQDPLPSSSSHREISPAPENVRAKSIGCMSGIFRFVCKYHNRRRFITSGKKQEKNVGSPPPQESSTDLPKSSGDVVPKSPTLPVEMRISADNYRSPPALIARLMGLSEIPTAETAVEEKRRRLLGALEKCDQDLKSLKKMIEVVKSVSGNTTNGNSKIEKLYYHMTTRKEKWNQLEAISMSMRSTLSMVDDFTSFCSYSKRHNNCTANGRAQQQRKRKPGEEDIINISLFERNKTEIIPERSDEKLASSPPWKSSKAMVDSVNEVCRDIAWGQRREIGRIGLALQDYIFRDIIEETVREMGCYFFYPSPILPLESCKRRLRF